MYKRQVKNRFKELDLVDRVPKELWMEAHNIVQEHCNKNHPKEKEMQERKVAIQPGLTNSREAKQNSRQRGKVTENGMQIFQRIARRDKRAFLKEQCKEIEENNRKGKTRDLFKKI